MNNKPVAVRYIRTSVTGYAQTADIARQKDVCDKVAGRHGLNVTDTYEDICDPATPAMDRLLADAKAVKVDIVVCSSLDRLVRSSRRLSLLLDSGLDVVSLDVDTRAGIDPGSADVISLISRVATDELGRPAGRRVRK